MKEKLKEFEGNTSKIFEWFGENHGLYPMIVVDQTTYPKWAFEIARFIGNPKDLSEKEWYWDSTILSSHLYRKREEAELECIQKLIEIVEGESR